MKNIKGVTMIVSLNLKTNTNEHNVSGSLNHRAPFLKNQMKPSSVFNDLIKFEMTETDCIKLKEDTLGAVEKFGNWGYRLKNYKDDAGYLGTGLTYNPRHVDSTNDFKEQDIHQQVQGNYDPGAKGLNGQNPYSRLTGKDSVFAKLNTHYDTFSMCYRTPASKHGYLGDFCNTFKRSMVRSSIRVINAAATGHNMGKDINDKKMRAGVAWHTDESIFENLRINIPVETHPIFVLEQKGYPPQHLQANYAYSWNTSLLHRAYCTEKTEAPLYRTHIMLGFSCWWDFDEATETWTQNEFFGKKHPWDMLNDGEVIPGLKLV